MDVTIDTFEDETHVVELGEDDTPAVMRRKVASAVGLPEDSFVMSFGGEAMDEGYDMTQLSAGDTVILAKTQKFEAIAELHALGETDLTYDRLENVWYPEVACLLLQAEVATVIPVDFLSGRELTRLDLSDTLVVREIGNSFLRQCKILTTVDLSGLTNVTRIGSRFLASCRVLTEVNLSGFYNVTTIDYGFLFNCTALTKVNLSGLRSVTTIRCYFLHSCASLESVDLSGMRGLTSVGAHFLRDCNVLATINVSNLDLSCIGGGFLAECPKLCRANIIGLSGPKCDLVANRARHLPA